MSLSSVHGTLSSLKTCQTDVGTGMDTVTDMALDLLEAQDENLTPAIREMETMILECARLDMEINYFVDTVKQVTSEVTSQHPETMVNLSTKVREQFTERIARLSADALQNHPKVAAFKDGVQTSSSRANQNAAENTDDLDDEITVTQSQVNLSCPLTQLEMVNPVRNKKCNHHYDEQAILSLIKTKQKQKKTCRCPVVGCANLDVRQSDLVPDQLLKRRIQSQKRQGTRT